MKFIISSFVLLKNLQTLSGVLSSSNALPILDDFLFELKDDILNITASDLETTITVTLQPTKAEKKGNVTIPAKILLDTLKTLPDIPVTININEETMLVEISAGEGKYKLPGHRSDEFPQKPEKEDITTVDIESGILVEAFNKTIFATGSDELRPVMSGVFCELTPDDITFVATDAHKLVRYRRKDMKAEHSASIILPQKPLNQLKNILPDDETKVRVEYNQTNAFFSFENVDLSCRLIEGKYPNYDAVIPGKNPNKLIIERNLLLNSIKRVSIFANQSTHQVRFKISGKELILSAEDVDFSNEAEERLTCNYLGDNIEIGFNSRFMMEMLANLTTEEIRLEMSEPNRAGIIIPENNKNENEDILMLVMPVMLNQ